MEDTVCVGLTFLCLLRLEEMTEYCTNVGGCRRETFSNVFGADQGVVARPFQPCGGMCDNCLARRASGAQRGSQQACAEAPRHVYVPEDNEQMAPGRGRKRPAGAALDLTRSTTSAAGGNGSTGFVTASGKAVRQAGDWSSGLQICTDDINRSRNVDRNRIPQMVFDCRNDAEVAPTSSRGSLSKLPTGVFGGSMSNSSRQAARIGIKVASRLPKPQVVELFDSDTE